MAFILMVLMDYTKSTIVLLHLKTDNICLTSTMQRSGSIFPSTVNVSPGLDLGLTGLYGLILDYSWLGLILILTNNIAQLQ